MRGTLTQSLLSPSAFAFLASFLSCSAALAQTFDVIAQSQSTGPRGPGIGGDPAATFFLFGAGNDGAPVVAGNGDVFYNAEYGSPGPGGLRAMFRHRAGGNEPIIRNNDSVTSPTGLPDAPTFALEFNPFSPPANNQSQPYPSDDGSVAFYSRAGGGAATYFGVWKRSASGVITPLFITNTDGPLGPQLGTGVVLGNIPSTTIVHSATGTVACSATSFLPSTVDSLLHTSPSLVRTNIARTRGPSIIPGRDYNSLSGLLLSAGSSGDLVHFGAALRDFPNNSIVARGAATNLGVVALSGSDGPLGPNLGSGSIFTDSGFAFSVQGASNTGTLLTSEIVPFLAPSERVLVHLPATGLATMLARTGTPGAPGPLGPGFGPDVNFFSFAQPVLGDTGRVVFIGLLSGPNITSQNNVGIFVTSAQGGAPVCIARLGETTGPLAPPIAGYTWAFSSFTLEDMQFAINARDEVVFLTSVRDPSFTFRSVLFRWSPSTGLVPLVIGGITTFDAALEGDAEPWRISSLAFNGRSGGNDGRNTGLADDGMIYISAGLSAVNRTRGLSTLLRIAPTTACDDIDFNNDELFPDDNDLIDFLSVLAGGPCSTAPSPGCNTIDFNRDGLFPDDNDLIDFLIVLAGGTCP
jgi:hypothetical protein